ncbi:MAG: PilZ domain-containing protein [Labilithrix sp.]|nr:PilZ domain-containing protein [Labilithrix sp.]
MLHSVPLGRLLIETGSITQAALDEVLALQKTDRRRLGVLLVERGHVQPQQLAQLLSRQLSCPWISLDKIEIAPDVVALLPREAAVAFNVVPVHLRAGPDGKRALYIATDDPTNEMALGECAQYAKMPVRPMVAVTHEVHAALTRFYGAPPGDAPPAPAPAPPAARQAPPPLPRRKTDYPTAIAVEDADVIEVDAPRPAPKRAPTVLTLNAPEPFLAQCRAAGKALGATVIDGVIMRAGELVKEHRPCAIVVTDDVYAFDRSRLNRLALDNDAHLVVWADDADGHQLEPLIAGAIDRWGRSSYEKGAIVDGRFELLRDLGDTASHTSSMGSRWEVRNVRTARRSVLALAIRTEGDDAGANAIRREQLALAKVSHPGAIELRDAGTTELGDPYLVLEPLEGRSLDGLVAAREKLQPDEACAVVLQIADVLVAAHAVGVTHGNVVAEQIIVVRDGYGVERVKLTGWGRAAVTDPESVAPAGDIRGLGRCAYEALTGRLPKEGEESGLAEPLGGVVARAVATENAFATMRELASALSAAAPRARERTQLLERSLGASSRESLPAGTSPPQSAAAPGPAAGEATATGPEQRRHARAPYRTPVRIEVPGLGVLDGRSEDISRGGLLVVSRGGLSAGTEVTVRFALPLDGKVVAEAAVVKWSRAARADESSGRALGVELTSPSQECVRQIERYVSLMGDGSESTFTP